MRHYIEVIAWRHHGDPVLVTAQKAVIEARGELPPNVRIEHFNALSGLDRHRDVRCHIQIGRTMRIPLDVELGAEILTGDAVPQIAPGEWYKKSPAALSMRSDGEGPQVFTRGGRGNLVGRTGTDRHPDLVAEAIRWGICEGELLQGIGRGRGVNRNADHPLEIPLLCNVPLPLPVDETGTFEDLKPNPSR